MGKLADLLRLQQEQIRQLTEVMARQSAALEAISRPEVGADLTVQKLREDYDRVVSTRAGAIGLRSHLAPAVAHFGARTVLSLRPSDWIDFRDNVRAKRVTQRKVAAAPGTLNQETKAFLAMVNWAVKDGRLSRNPLGRIPLLPVQAPETTISRADELAVLRAASDEMRAIFLLGVDVGMRLQEIRLLERAWIDFEHMRINLPAWVTKARRARSPRLTERAADALRALPTPLRSRWVFTNAKTGKPISKTLIHDWWTALREELDLKPAPGERAVVFHATRHTAATRINKLRGVKVAMRQLGQSSAAVGLRYIHASDDDLDEMRAALDEANSVAARQRATSESSTVNRSRVNSS